MQVGDIVRHKHGTLSGFGLVLEVHPLHVRALWTAHRQTVVHEVIASMFLEVFNESR